jgi:hypothetical protein
MATRLVAAKDHQLQGGNEASALEMLTGHVLEPGFTSRHGKRRGPTRKIVVRPTDL